MARIVTYQGKPLVRDGAPVVWDGEGPPPPECCCEAGCCISLQQTTGATINGTPFDGTAERPGFLAGPGDELPEPTTWGYYIEDWNARAGCDVWLWIQRPRISEPCYEIRLVFVDCSGDSCSQFCCPPGYDEVGDERECDTKDGAGFNKPSYNPETGEWTIVFPCNDGEPPFPNSFTIVFQT
jgi:hypothetical protein